MSLRAQVVLFTLLRLIVDTSYRMLYPFLAVLARGMGVELSAVSLAVTSRSIVGALGPFLAFISDSRGHKTGMLLGMGMYTVGISLPALWPGYPAFFAAMILSTLGSYVFIPSMQAYLSEHIPYARRGRTMALNELSWSLAFIIGVPLTGLLIARQGWQAPFPYLAVLSLAALLFMALRLPGANGSRPVPKSVWANFGAVLSSPAARAGLFMGMAMTTANEVVNLVFGVWMEDSFGLQIAALGAASAVIGISELGGEGFAAALVDRFGKQRAIRLGLVLNTLAALALPLLGRSLPGALLGLFFLYLTFEFTIVGNLPLISSLLPGSRATLMAAYIAFLSLGRAVGALLATALYSGSLVPNVAAALLFNLTAMLLLRWVHGQEG